MFDGRTKTDVEALVRSDAAEERNTRAGGGGGKTLRVGDGKGAHFEKGQWCRRRRGLRKKG